MERSDVQNRKQHYPSGIQNAFNNLKNRDNKVDFYRNLEGLNGDSCLYKSKPGKIPEKYLLLVADIPDLLEKKAVVHYQGKYYDELVKNDPEFANDSKMFEDRWTSDEVRNFELACKLLHGRHKNKSKIDYLKEKLPHKTAKEIIQHYYIFHQPNFKKKSKQAYTT